jgi:UDP-glucose-4-epimerase GalE
MTPKHEKQVLVTGGAGYIGSHVCKALSAAGYLPTVYDDLSTGFASAVRWGELVEANLADRARLLSALRESGAATVVHLAASAYVGESMRDPGKYFRNNVANTLSLLETMAASGVRRIIFSSSCAVYGVPTEIPVSERAARVPVSPYGESKLMCERLIRWFGEAHGIDWVALRYFNAGGADESGTIGEWHDPEPHLIPNVLRAAIGGQAFRMYGADYATPDGSAVRDFVHVADLADAHIRAVRYLECGGASVALNLGTGTGVSVKEVVLAAERVTGSRITVEHCPRRKGDPPTLLASAALARRVIGWCPLRPDIETIVRDAWGSMSRSLDRECPLP